MSAKGAVEGCLLEIEPGKDGGFHSQRAGNCVLSGGIDEEHAPRRHSHESEGQLHGHLCFRGAGLLAIGSNDSRRIRLRSWHRRSMLGVCL